MGKIAKKQGGNSGLLDPLQGGACVPWLFTALMLVFSWPAWSQPESSQTQDVDTEAKLRAVQPVGQLQVAPVIVNGEVLFHLVGVPTAPAEPRANIVAEAIEALANDSTFNSKTLRIVEDELHHKIFPGTGRRSLVTIFDEDAALEGPLEREIVASTIRDRIMTAIDDYRHERRPDVLLSNVLRALLRTAILAALLWGVFWGFRKLDAYLERRFKRDIEKLEAKSLRIIQAEQLLHALNVLLRVTRTVIVLVLAYVFINFVLTLFPWTRYVANTLLSLIVDPLRDITAAVIDYIPSLIFLVLLFFITRYLLKALRGFFAAIARQNIKLKSFDAEWAIPTYRLIRVLVIVFAVVLAYPYIPGSDSDAFKGISILLGVLFSLGSTSMISNLIAGYTMTYRRAFRIGDRVKIANTMGDVTEMRLLVTHVRTLKNEEVIIPNSTILNNEVINYSTMAHEKGLILHTTVGIGYEVPWRQVEAMLLLAAERTEGLLKEPKPFVLQTALADYAVNYELNVFCKNEKQYMALYTALHRNIQDVFNEYGIQIMTPSYMTDTPEPKVVPKEQWYAEPALQPNPKET